MNFFRETPIWVWGIIVALAAIEPLTHLWIEHGKAEGLVHSGLHNLDTYAYRSAMEHYGNDYFSPYASCESPVGDHDASLYALPHHHLYGLLGMLGRALHLPGFFFLGLANGLGLAFLLVSSYALLCTAVPTLARRAFLLFSLGGGLGGALYVTTGLLGMHDDGTFAENFQRFFLYELSEGARSHPHLLMSRLYYTIAFGLAYLGLASLAASLKDRSTSLIWVAAVLQCATSFLNMRVGPMIWVVAVIYLLCATERAPRQRWLAALLLTLSTALGAGAAATMLSANPELSKSVFRVLSGCMWLAPFISATALYWCCAPGALARGLHALPVSIRWAGFGFAGYSVTFTALYILYQLYFGNLLRGGDTAAAVAVSDWSILGFGAGALLSYFRPVAPQTKRAETEYAWAALWFLVFFVAAASAFGQGWYLQFMPQRFIVVLGLPLAIVAAAGLDHYRTSRPRLAHVLTAAIVGCGIVSISVTWFVTHGPLGHATIQKQFRWTNYVYITEADANVLDHLKPGVFLAPSAGTPLFGDVVAQRPGMHVVYGNGTMDYTRQIMPEVRARVVEFYEPDATSAARLELIKDWCVDYVFVPNGGQVDARTRMQLHATPWLEEVATEDEAVLFRTKKEGS